MKTPQFILPLANELVVDLFAGGGGGASSATRMALIALMVAIEQDNTQRPDKDWWAKRMTGGAA